MPLAGLAFCQLMSSGFFCTREPSRMLLLCDMGSISPICRKCVCGKNLTVEHGFTRPTGGMPTLRHNEIRDLTADLMTEICQNVSYGFVMLISNIPHLQMCQNVYSILTFLLYFYFRNHRIDNYTNLDKIWGMYRHRA